MWAKTKPQKADRSFFFDITSSKASEEALPSAAPVLLLPPSPEKHDKAFPCMIIFNLSYFLPLMECNSKEQLARWWRLRRRVASDKEDAHILTCRDNVSSAPWPPASAGCSAGAGVHPRIVLAELSLATAHQSAIKKVTCASTHVGFRASAQTNASQSDQGVRRSFMKLGVSGLKETGFGKYSNSL